MILLASILVAAIVLGWALGGRLRNLADVRIRLWPLLPLSLALQLAPVPQIGEGLGRYLPVALVFVSYAILIAVVAVNWRLRGFVLILVGSTLNLAVIAANQGMPVSRDAIVASENLSLLEGLPTERGTQYHAASDDDVLLPLADVIPVREPFGVVISVGDVLTYGGAGVFLTASMLRRPAGRAARRHGSRSREAERARTSGTPP